MRQLRTRLTDDNWEKLYELSVEQDKSITTILNELLTSALSSKADNYDK